VNTELIQLKDSILLRGKKVSRGWRKLGFIIALLQTPALFRHQGFIAWWQIFGTIVFFWLIGWLYYKRSHYLALNGKFRIAQIAAKEFTFGTDALPSSSAHVPFNIVQSIWQIILRFFGSSLPTRVVPLSIEIKGKNRYADMYLYSDEEPIVTTKGEVLCLTATDLWFYPPSPWIVRIRNVDRDQDKYVQHVKLLIEEYKQTGNIDVENDAAELNDGEQAFKKMWIAVIVAAAIITLLYLPLLSGFGWLGILVIPIFLSIPVILGLIRRKSG